LSKGARVDLEKIPVSKQLKKVFTDVKKQTEFALFGAEDYELVFTVPKNAAQKLKKTLAQISYIGEIVNSNEVKYFYNGKEQKTIYAGFKHF
jgi:thiamine-monophosphate kinase